MNAFVFDIDDTLYHELDYRDSGYRVIAEHFAASCGMEPQALYRLMKDDPSQAFERVSALAAKNGVEVTVPQQLFIYRSHRPDISLTDDAEFVLSRLHDANIPMGIITDGRAWGQLNKIAALQLERFIPRNRIMATVLDSTDKHSAEPFRKMATLMRDAGATHITYVGDNPIKDFHHPNLMGWHTVMLRDTAGRNVHTQNLDAFPPEFRPQTTVLSLKDLTI